MKRVHRPASEVQIIVPSYARTLRSAAVLVAAGALITLAGCAGGGSTGEAGSAATGASSPSASATPQKASVTPAPKQHPAGPPMLLDSIAPLDHTKVGVAMPISIAFTDPVKPSARKDVEEHIELSTSQPVTGAWHWFGDQRADFRPEGFWKPGTKVHMVAAFADVGDGHGRYGTHSYSRDFTIGDDVHTYVRVKQHKTVVEENGKVVRTMSSDAGSPDFPSWDGTMAVVNKERTTRMTSCSVGIACDESDPDFYDLVLPWDVRITNSGTFLHYSTGDPSPGHSYGSHGCVHLSMSDAEWFYDKVEQGDPVTITGSPRGKADGDNGFADYNVSWSTWLSASGRKAFTTDQA